MNRTFHDGANPDVSHIMKSTRVVIGLATFIFVMVPLLGLARLSYDIRYLDFMLVFSRSGAEFPSFANSLWIFGPLDSWSYITPLALSIAAASALRIPLRNSVLAVILGSAVLQAFVLAGTAKPYLKLYSVMGNPLPAPYPIIPLVANLALVVISVGLARLSVSRLLAHYRAERGVGSSDSGSPSI